MVKPRIAACTPDIRASQLIGQITTGDAYELRRLLNILNTPRSCDKHDRICVVEHAYIRGLIMLKAARDVRQHEWMFSRIDALHNALSLFNDALLKLNRARQDAVTTYEDRCALGLMERDITFEAMVVISMLKNQWGIETSSDDAPDTSVLFKPEIANITKAQTCGFVLQSRKLLRTRATA